MYILKLRTNSLLSLMLGDDETEVGRRRGKFTPDFGAVHPQPLNLGIKYVNIASPLNLTPNTNNHDAPIPISPFDTIIYDISTANC